MADRLDPTRIRRLTEELVALPSVSPDPDAERICGERVFAELPEHCLRGRWLTADGRPVVWALARGRSPRTVLMLGHYDTVEPPPFECGAKAEAHEPRSEKIDEESIRASITYLDERHALDREEERRAPGTWMYGRGALDMKSGLAVGLAVFGTLAERADELEGSVLFVACPDEEHESAGMRTAVPKLLELRERQGLEFLGALNLDFSTAPAAYAGVMGKRLIGAWVLGEPTHVSEPFEGVDALQLAAAIAPRAAYRSELADRWGDLVGRPPVLLRLRDLKQEYNVQTAREVSMEFNYMTLARALAQTLEVMRGAAQEAIAASERERAAAAGRHARANGGSSTVLCYSELLERAGIAAGADPLAGDTAAPSETRERSLARVRRLAHQARLAAPAVVLYLIPPFYPHAAPGDGPLVAAARRVLETEGVPVLPFYPYISDASYVAWRDEPEATLSREMPALGREYELPIAAAAALDLDVVNLGPWGREAHGGSERVHAPYAFERLPRWIVEVVRAALAT